MRQPRIFSEERFITAINNFTTLVPGWSTNLVGAKIVSMTYNKGTLKFEGSFMANNPAIICRDIMREFIVIGINLSKFKPSSKVRKLGHQWKKAPLCRPMFFRVNESWNWKYPKVHQPVQNLIEILKSTLIRVANPR